MQRELMTYAVDEQSASANQDLASEMQSKHTIYAADQHLATEMQSEHTTYAADQQFRCGAKSGLAQFSVLNLIPP